MSAADGAFDPYAVDVEYGSPLACRRGYMGPDYDDPGYATGSDDDYEADFDDTAAVVAEACRATTALIAAAELDRAAQLNRWAQDDQVADDAIVLEDGC